MRYLVVMLIGALLLFGSRRQLDFLFLPAEPALWSVRDKDSTIYLFGTVHVLDGYTKWRTEKVNRALGASQELWVEVADAGDPSAMAQAVAPLVQRLAVDPSIRLSTRVPAADWEALGAAAPMLGAKADDFEPLKPWAVAFMLDSIAVRDGGFQASLGADSLLVRLAREQGKPVHGFETANGQIQMLANLPMEAQVQMLHSSLEGVSQGTFGLMALVRAWSRGDTTKLERLAVDPMRQESPAFYRALIVARNEAWADKLEDRLKGSGVSFVAVGAAHLIGPDSVQALLAKRHAAVRRE